MRDAFSPLRRRWLLASLLAPSLALRTAARTMPPFSEADLAHAAALREAGLHDMQAWPLLQSLVREVGPRPAGSAGDARAVRWALDRLAQLGFANVRADPVPLTAWQRGATRVLLLAPDAQLLVAEALGNSVAPEGGAVEAEVAYYADFASLRDDRSDRARGRIAFVDQKTERARDGSGYGRAIGARVAGAIEAARRGALAVVIRSLGTDHDPIAHTGSLRYDPQVPAIPGVAVSVPDAERIAALHTAGRTPRLRLEMAPTARVAVTSHNVIGEVPGTDRAEEVVLISAHLDTWDITPGAQDDGAGVAIVMAAGCTLLQAARRPRRTVRVVLFANEENGFDGAHRYAEMYRDVPHQLVGESDFGAGRIWRLRSRVRAEALPAIAAMAEVLAPLGIAAEGNDGSPGPDAGVLARTRGWPAIDLTQDGTGYFDIHHTVSDTLDRVDPATLPQNVAAWAAVAWLAAQAEVAFGPAR